MTAVLVQVLPFFALIGVGFGAGKRGFFGPEATAALTKFVFWFALPAMLLRFSAKMALGDVLDWTFIAAYAGASLVVYGLVTVVALLRRRGGQEAAVEASIGVVGNVGFLGVPMLAMLLGEAAIAPVMMVLAVDLMLFGSLIVILMAAYRDGRVRLGVLASVGRGLIANPMIVSFVAGFAFAATGWPLPGPVDDFLGLLGAAATPGALFAIGASLATKSAERMGVAVWLSFAKLVLHPGAVALAALVLLPVEPFAAGVMIAAAALPVAGNVYILAAHFGVAAHRASAAILVSTTASILTVTAVIAWVQGMIGG